MQIDQRGVFIRLSFRQVYSTVTSFKFRLPPAPPEKYNGHSKVVVDSTSESYSNDTLRILFCGFGFARCGAGVC